MDELWLVATALLEDLVNEEEKKISRKLNAEEINDLISKNIEDIKEKVNDFLSQNKDEVEALIKKNEEEQKLQRKELIESEKNPKTEKSLEILIKKSGLDIGYTDFKTYKEEDVFEISLYVAKEIREILKTKSVYDIYELLQKAEDIAGETITEGLIDITYYDEEFEELKNIVKDLEKDYEIFKLKDINSYESFDDYISDCEGIVDYKSDEYIDILSIVTAEYLIRNPKMLNNELAVDFLFFVSNSVGYAYIAELINMDILELKNLINNKFLED